MKNIKRSLHSKVQNWIKTIGFKLNNSQIIKKDDITINHYFFETFNFIESAKKGNFNQSKILCFDVYGEKINVRSLLDLQTAFFDNISRLK